MAPLLLRPPAPPRPRYLQPEPTKNARVEMLAVLNKSEGVTCGAAQGDGQSEDTGLRTGNVVRAEEKSPAPTPAKSYGKPVAANKPPRMELDGKKWNVEYFKNKQDIAINEVEVNQSVYVYKCEGSTVKVNGKCNNIIIDGCKKTAVVFESVVSSVEFINCQSVQMQVSRVTQ